jgi:hypothetical protein
VKARFAMLLNVVFNILLYVFICRCVCIHLPVHLHSHTYTQTSVSMQHSTPRTFSRTDLHTHRGVPVNQRANTLAHRCPELTTLNLDFNSVGDEGTIALVFALSDPSRLGALANLHLNSNKCSALPSPSPCLSLITLTRCLLILSALPAIITVSPPPSLFPLLSLASSISLAP